MLRQNGDYRVFRKALNCNIWLLFSDLQLLDLRFMAVPFRLTQRPKDPKICIVEPVDHSLRKPTQAIQVQELNELSLRHPPQSFLSHFLPYPIRFAHCPPTGSSTLGLRGLSAAGVRYISFVANDQLSTRLRAIDNFRVMQSLFSAVRRRSR